MDVPRFHPLAELFPLIEGKEFDELVADIKANGLREAIVLDAAADGQIIDGRNRYRACEAAAAAMRFEILPEGTDLLAYVISKNLHRRHLSPSQRAMLAADIETYRHGGDRRSDQDANLHLEREEAAEIAGASPRSVASAAKVRDEGVPELGEAVRKGQVAVSVAAEIAALPIDEQKVRIAEIANSPDTKKAFSGVVKELRREKQDEKRGKRDQREVDLGAKQRALPDKKYGLILADPEWPFEVWSEATGQDRAAKNHYPTSTIDDIAARPVEKIAADDCVLLLWATAPKLPDALHVLKSWGFTYVTHAIWVKDRIGTGYWFRNNHEILLLGKRGDPPKPADGTQFNSALTTVRGAHSEKPDWQYEIAERYFPTLPKIELNARRRRVGWDAWGLEAPEESQAKADSEAPATQDAAASAEAESVSRLADGRTSVSSSSEKDGPESLRGDSVNSETASPLITSDPSASDGLRVGAHPEGGTAEDSRPAPDRVATIAKLRETLTNSVKQVDDMPDLPDELERVALTRTEIITLTRIRTDDCDRDEQAFVIKLRRNMAGATVADQKRLAALAKAQGLTTEQVL